VARVIEGRSDARFSRDMVMEGDETSD